MKHVRFGRFVFQQLPHQYIIEVRRGNDYGEPSYLAEIVCDTKEQLLEELEYLSYYDILLGIREGVQYEIDWDETNKEDDDDESIL